MGMKYEQVCTEYPHVKESRSFPTGKPNMKLVQDVLPLEVLRPGSALRFAMIDKHLGLVLLDLKQEDIVINTMLKSMCNDRDYFRKYVEVWEMKEFNKKYGC